MGQWCALRGRLLRDYRTAADGGQKLRSVWSVKLPGLPPLTMGWLDFSFVWLINKTLLLTLCVGITFGFSFAYMVLSLAQYGPRDGFYARLLGSRSREWFGPDPAAMFEPRVDDVLQSATFTNPLAVHSVDTVPEGHGPNDPAHTGGDAEAVELAGRVRVLCWVMTQPANHEKKARHVKATWGRRCNKLIFMSSKADPDLPTVALDVQEGRNFLWAKTKEAFRYVYEHHRDEADWFFKADDDTYAVMENMRLMLEPYSPNDAIYFGCKFKPFTKQGYMSGGAGYVLSGEALRRFVTVGLNDPTKCKKDHGGAEDAEMGKCLERLNVTAGDSRDSLGRYRFFPFTPESHLVAEKFPKNFWYWKYIFYPQLKGMDCCSDSAISFHYVPPNMMYTIEYLVYHLKPFGVRTRLVPGAPPDRAVVPAGVHFPTERGKPATTAPPAGRPTALVTPITAARAAPTTRGVAETTPSPRPTTTREEAKKTPPTHPATTREVAGKAPLPRPATAHVTTPPTRVRRSVAASTRARRRAPAAPVQPSAGGGEVTQPAARPSSAGPAPGGYRRQTARVLRTSAPSRRPASVPSRRPASGQPVGPAERNAAKTTAESSGSDAGETTSTSSRPDASQTTSKPVRAGLTPSKSSQQLASESSEATAEPAEASHAATASRKSQRA